MATDVNVKIPESVTALFKETALQELLSPQQSVVILKDTATVDQALKALATHRILSAPVVATQDASAKCGCLAPLFDQSSAGAHWPQAKGLSGSSQILGFLDVRDVLSSFLADLGGAERVKGMKMLQRMRLLDEKGQPFAGAAIKDLQIFGGDGDFFHADKAKESVYDVVISGLLNPKERGSHTGTHIMTGTVHRAAIYDSQFRLTNIISQTDIVKFMYMNKSALGDFGKRTAAELGWANRPVVSLGPDVSAIEAMLLMNERQISAVAVVDGVNKIIGNFSVSEMRTIMAEHFGALALPVGEFLALEHKTEFVGYSHIHEQDVVESKGHKFITDRVARARPRTPGEEVGQSLVLVTPETPLTEIMEKLVENKIHRVYVVDAEERPVGLVTCTDVLRLLAAAS